MMNDEDVKFFQDLANTPQAHKRKSAVEKVKKFMGGGLAVREGGRYGQKRRSLLQQGSDAVRTFSRSLSAVSKLRKVKEARVHNALDIAMDKYLGKAGAGESYGLFEKRSSDLKDNFALPGRHQRNSGAPDFGNLYYQESLSPLQKGFLQKQKKARKAAEEHIAKDSSRSQSPKLQFDLSTQGGVSTRGPINASAFKKQASKSRNSLATSGKVYSKSLLTRASVYTDLDTHLANIRNKGKKTPGIQPAKTELGARGSVFEHGETATKNRGWVTAHTLIHTMNL